MKTKIQKNESAEMFTRDALAASGVKSINDPETVGKFVEYVADAVEAFPEFFGGEPFWYAEDFCIEIVQYVVGYEENESENKTDGRALSRFREENEVLKMQCCLCIHKAAIERGREYTILVLLHELTHLLTDSSNPIVFHGLLDSLLRLYEARTGEHIENDYCDPC